LPRNKGKLDLDARQAEIFVRDARAVGDHHRVEEVAVVRLIDLRERCIASSQADLVWPMSFAPRPRSLRSATSVEIA